MELRETKWLENRVANLGAGDNSVQQLSKADRLQFYRAFSTKLFNELDKSSGSCVLRTAEFSKIVFDAILYFQGTRVTCGDFVVMPNHVHALLTPLGKCELEDVLHSIKSFTAHEIQMKRRSSGTFWMKESHDHIVRDVEELVRIQRYIRSNPVKANISEGQFRLYTAEYQLD